jgi:hypothetical protein
VSTDPSQKPEHSWASLKDEDLLTMRIRDLGLKVEGSELDARVQQLHEELATKGLIFKPKVYLGDEWFSPEGVPAIAIPFYLSHPRLKQLEQKMMLEVEGGTPNWCMKLLRHECGHCFDHAYGFSRRPKWRELFGSPNQEYHPETYRPRPYSRSYVHHLDNWYAQAHPDEDFAETFAVWLAPECDWREQYRDWPGALAKLEYIDQLAHEVARKKPKITGGPHPFNATRIARTLEKYYARRRKENATDYPDFYDRDLRRIFSGEVGLSKRDFGAARYMTRNRKLIVESVAYWTGERKYPIELLVKKLTARCESLDLRLSKNEAQTNLEIASYLATLVTHYLFTGKFKRSV